MYKIAAQLRVAAANKKAEDFSIVHPQTNKRFVGAIMQSFGGSIKDMNNVKLDPTSIGVAATKYPAEYILFCFYLR